MEMIQYSIFIIDDEEMVREGIAPALKKHYFVKDYATVEDGLPAIKNNPPDLVLLDIGLPGMSGIEGLKEIKQLHSEILVIMITAFEDVETVVSAMKLGAYDYVVKPLHVETLLLAVQNALETIKMRKEIQVLQEKYLNENCPCFIGESNAIQNVMETVQKVAQSPDTPILISGETGTGKELIASAIHYRSPNYKGPFVTVNCAAIPKDLIESELFGYEKGAFSGAKASGKKGLVEKAQGGTLFLDEVGDLGINAQAKLLRFLEGGEFYKVGGTKKLHIQTRIISATNKNLQEMVLQSGFREDLYYRLAVIQLVIPSLAQRPDDIIPIAKYFLAEFSRKLDKSFTDISPEAHAALMAYRWKGNVRELRNIIEGAVLIAEGPELTPENLCLSDGAEFLEGVSRTPISSNEFNARFPKITQEGIDFLSMIESFETYCIVEALKVAEGNESKAAELLNVSRDTFRYRKKKLRLG